LRAGGSVLVIVQQPPAGLFPVTLGVQAAGQEPGVLVDQVVRPVPAGGWLGEQVMLIQRLQAAAGRGQAGAIEGGGGVPVDVGAGVQREAAEQPLLPGCEVVVRQVERGGDRRYSRNARSRCPSVRSVGRSSERQVARPDLRRKSYAHYFCANEHK
jgi:hypothetical protein